LLSKAVRVFAVVGSLAYPLHSALAGDLSPIEGYEKQIRDRTGCTEKKLRILSSSVPHPSSGFVFAVWTYDCLRSGIVLLAWPTRLNSVEIDRVEFMEGFTVSTRFLRLRSGTVLSLTVFAFEVAARTDDFLLRVVQAGEKSPLLSAWSSEEPLLPSEGEAPDPEVVIFKNAIGLRDPGFQGWPIVVSLGAGVAVDDLERHPEVVRAAQRATDQQIGELVDACRKSGDEKCEQSEPIEAMRVQSEALKRLLTK
jgi:hypothetical protein